MGMKYIILNGGIEFMSKIDDYISNISDYVEIKDRYFETNLRLLKYFAEIGNNYIELIKKLKSDAIECGGTHLELQAVAVDGQFEHLMELVYSDQHSDYLIVDMVHNYEDYKKDE